MKSYISIFKKNYIETPKINFKEGVVSPKYYKEIESYLMSLKNNIKKLNFDTLTKLCKWLTKNLKKYSIRFVPNENNDNKYFNKEFQAGITQSGCLSNKKGTVKIYCNNNLLKIQNDDKFFNYFVKNVIRIIGHELIHRNQIFEIENQELRNYIFDFPKETVKYLSNKQEMMSRAWQIIEEFRYNGLTDKQIANILRSNKDTRLVAYSTTFMYYLEFFNIKDPIFKKLWKYAYSYLTNQEIR
jgi:hypothetical protein